jgi:hypothetical protein
MSIYYKRNIPNPYAHQAVFYDYQLDPPAVVEFDYNSEENRDALLVIHDACLNFGKMLNHNFTSQQKQAYAHLYPQNAVFSPDGLESFDALSMIYNEAEIDSRLISEIVNPLTDAGQIGLYLSPTTKEARLPKNQLKLTGDPAQYPDSQKIAQLISIPWKVSLGKMRALREQYGLPLVGPYDQLQPRAIDRSIYVPVEPQNADIDLDNWENNLEPGSYVPRVYYNSKRNEYQYIKRTKNRNRSAYDIGARGSSLQNMNTAVQEAISACLTYVGKNTPDNVSSLLALGYHSPRPGHPEGNGIGFFSSIDRRPASPWNLFVRFNKDIIDNVPSVPTAETDGLLDADSYPYEIANKIASPANRASQYITVSFKFLKENMGSLIKIVRHYYSEQIMSGVGPSYLAGLDMEREIIFLESFLSRLEKFNDINNISNVSDSDAYQFLFDDDLNLQYIIFNGRLYTVGVGLTTFTTRNDNLPMLAASYNAFYGFTSHTFSFIKNFDTILNETILKNRSPKGWMGWVEFLQRFVNTNLQIHPEKQSFSKEEYTKANPTTNLFEKISEITSRGGTEARIEGLISSTNKLVSTRDRLFTEYKSAVGSCDTHLAAFGRDAATLMELAMGRVNLQYVINHALFRVRDNLIEDEFLKKCVTEGVALKDESLRTGVPTVAASEANRIYAEVIKAVDEEIQCQIGIIGDKIQSLVLSPTGAPPHASELVRGTGAAVGSFISPGTHLSASPFKAKPSYAGTTDISIELKKKESTGVGDFWMGYSTYLGRLFDRLISQLFIGILRDILGSAMGCNPYDNGEDEEGKGLANRRKKSSYGLTNLNDYVSHINLVPLAEDLNMVNREVEENEAGRTIIVSPPTMEQLIQLNQDVSSILTPIELSTLLDGNTDSDLLATIREMIYSGDMSPGFNSLTTAQRIDPIFREKFDNSLDANDTLYGGLGLSENTIKNYFREIGGLISPANRDLMFRNQQITPDLANCDLKDTVVGMPGLSDEQLVLIFDQRVEAHMSKLDSLCSIDLGFEDIEIQIAKFMENIPDAQFYTDFLEWLTGASDWLEELISESAAEITAMPSRVSTARASNFPDSDLGRSLMPAVCDFPYNRDQCNPGYTYTKQPVFNVVVDDQYRTAPIRWRILPQPIEPLPPIPVRTGQGVGETIGSALGFYWRGITGQGIEVASPPMPPSDQSPNAVDEANTQLGPGALPFPLSYLTIGETIKIFYDPPGHPRYLLAEIDVPTTEDPANHLGLVQAHRDILKDELGLPTQYTLKGIYGTSGPTLGPRYIDYLTSPLYGAHNTNNTILTGFLGSSEAGILGCQYAANVAATYKKFYYDFDEDRDLNSFMSGISTDYFAADQKCLSSYELIIASSIQQVIKSRIRKLYLNAAPLLEVYPCWNQPSTVGLLADYISRNITRDFKSKSNLYDVLVENFNLFYEAYGHQFVNTGLPLNPDELSLPLEKKLPLVVRRCLLASFINLSDDRSGGAPLVGMSTFSQFRDELIDGSQNLADRLSTEGTPATDRTYLDTVANYRYEEVMIGVRDLEAENETILTPLVELIGRPDYDDAPGDPPLRPGEEGYEEQERARRAAALERSRERWEIIDDEPPHRTDENADNPEEWADQITRYTSVVRPARSPLYVMKMVPYLPFPAQYAQAIIAYDQIDVCYYSDYFNSLTMGNITFADENFSYSVSPERLLYGGFSRGNIY